jgi:hypothetical protein
MLKFKSLDKINSLKNKYLFAYFIMSFLFSVIFSISFLEKIPSSGIEDFYLMMLSLTFIFCGSSFFFIHYRYIELFDSEKKRGMIYTEKVTTEELNEKLIKYNCLNRICFVKDNEYHRLDSSAVFDLNYLNDEYWIEGFNYQTEKEFTNKKNEIKLKNKLVSF